MSKHNNINTPDLESITESDLYGYDVKNLKRGKKKSVRKFKDTKYYDDYGDNGWQITKWHTFAPFDVEMDYIKRVNKARSFNATSPTRIKPV